MISWIASCSPHNCDSIQTGAKSIDEASESLKKALAESGVTQGQVKGIVATGYGRVSIPFADKRMTEISCHALGAALAAKKNFHKSS